MIASVFVPDTRESKTDQNKAWCCQNKIKNKPKQSTIFTIPNISCLGTIVELIKVHAPVLHGPISV